MSKSLELIYCSVFRGNMTDFERIWRFSWLSEFLCSVTFIIRSYIEIVDFVAKDKRESKVPPFLSSEPGLSFDFSTTNLRDNGHLPFWLFCLEKSRTLGDVDFLWPLRELLLFRFDWLSSLTIALGWSWRWLDFLFTSRSIVRTIVGCNLNKLV